MNNETILSKIPDKISGLVVFRGRKYKNEVHRKMRMMRIDDVVSFLPRFKKSYQYFRLFIIVDSHLSYVKQKFHKLDTEVNT